MIGRFIIIAACAAMAIALPAANASADDGLGTGGLPGVDIAAQATKGVADLLTGLSSLPGVGIGATATCGAANLLWGLAGRPSGDCAARGGGYQG